EPVQHDRPLAEVARLGEHPPTQREHPRAGRVAAFQRLRLCGRGRDVPALEGEAGARERAAIDAGFPMPGLAPAVPAPCSCWTRPATGAHERAGCPRGDEERLGPGGREAPGDAVGDALPGAKHRAGWTLRGHAWPRETRWSTALRARSPATSRFESIATSSGS